MKATQYDLLAHLTDILTNYLKQVAIEFFCDTYEEYPISKYEAFMKCGCLSLFVSDKQPVIDQYIAQLNENRKPTQPPFFAKLEFYEDKNTYFGIMPEISHNLIVNNVHSSDMKPVYGLLKCLGYAILNSTMFVPKDNKISLDSFHDKMLERFKNKEIVIIPTEHALLQTNNPL